MFRKPKENKIGGKFLVIGATNTGKSLFGLTFPKVGAIDSETGLGFYEGRDIEIAGKKYNNLQFIDTTSNLDDLEDDLDEIIDGNVDIETLVIDSETKFYITMDIASTEVEERKARNKGKEVDTRSKWGRVKQINMKMQQAKITASANGVHVVSIAQEKEVTDENTKKVIDYIPDTHKALPYDYDVFLRFFTEVDSDGNKRYFAQVRKDRTNVTKDGQIIENCTYDIWKDYFEGRSNLETSGANFSKDLRESTSSVISEADLQEKLGDEIIKLIKNTKDSSLLKQAREKMKENKIEVSELKLAPIYVLKELKKILNK